jgi:hypothetical protein
MARRVRRENNQMILIAHRPNCTRRQFLDD